MSAKVARYTGKMGLEEYSDYELLHFLDDNEGKTSIELAPILEKSSTAIGARMAWMKRMGYVRRDKGKRWWLDSNGRMILASRGQIIASARVLAQETAADRIGGWIVNREYRRELQRNR